ncbi:MAG: hypothetical protein JJU05_09330 [Verrucomicrobia bacterium]|nr:hypothetical protein [Verrucomicrobiota bacterium]MCH8527588.1 hypothetical protein [Kiritimatiellia bacterium]
MSYLRTLRLLPLMGALALVFTQPLHAQYEIQGRVSNELSERPGDIPVGGTAQPTGSPTITPQFSSVVETSTSAGPISTSADLTARYPSSPAVVLQRASVGNTFSSGVPRYFLGDRMTPPQSYLNSGNLVVNTPAGFWRAEPIRAGEVVVNPSGHSPAESTGTAITTTPENSGIIVPALAPGLYETFYYSPHAKSVFAYQPGQVQLWWRSLMPDVNGNYILVKETFSVSSATANPVRSLYWTEKSFNGPRVTVPGGRIVTVNPVYSNTFPATVDEEHVVPGTSPPADPNAQPASELRTLWFEKNSGVGELHAYNVSGRILIEYLGELQADGSQEFLGADIVEVSRAAASTTLTVHLGNEIRPVLDGPGLVALPVTNSTSSGGTAYYGSFTRPDGTLAYYAERENNLEDRVVFYWLEPLDASIRPASGLASGLELEWPKYLHKYLQTWPDDVTQFAHNTVGMDGSSADTGTGLLFEGGRIPALIFQDDPSQTEAVIDSVTQRLLVGLGGDQLNRSLLKFTGTNGSVWYVRLMTQAAGRNDYLEGDGGAAFTAPATVGQRIDPPSADYTLAGYVASGTAFSQSAYKDPFATGVAAAKTGAILPVNTLAAEDNTLTVWWFKRVAPPSAEFPALFVPAKIGTYTVSYRSDDPKIVLASNSGSGDLAPGPAAGFIYVQNDPAQPGYNPNEEHALLLGGRAYALRDDLNITAGDDFTSLPRVLLQYTDVADGRPAMAAYEVLREDETHRFEYDITAGTILNSPMPLPLLPLPVDPATGLSRNREVIPDINLFPAEESLSPDAPLPYGQFTLKDRKGYDWVYRGPHTDPADSGITPALGMEWYYTMRDGFYIPGLGSQPAVGTILPYLRPQNPDDSFVGHPVTGTPLTVTYRPTWPVNAPTMSVGETLTLPNHGLPAVRGQSSAVTFYQQSVATDGPDSASVTLHDPTRAKTVLLNAANVGLTQLPASAATTPYSGKTYFQLLPPHLQNRFYFDATLGEVGGLVLVGEFVREIAGEDYLHLNALSPEEVASLKAVVTPTDNDYQSWSNAVDSLTTRVETFVENPAIPGTYIVDSARTVTVGPTQLAAITDSDTAVDSYALTATGAGAGFVSMLFGNGEAFTPEGEPVTVSILRVVPQLYTGDLKTLPASNPLDEQTTLRHSGDFAARPGDFEFEWRYASPQNGVQPATYTYDPVTTLGAPGADHWLLAVNPTAPLPATYPDTEYPFPRTLAIRDSAYDASSGRPATVAKAASPLHFVDTVPAQITFSAELGAHDGFILYVNGTAALASRLPAGVATPTGLTATDARSGLSPLGLTHQYTVPSTYFVVGDNRIEIALFTSAVAGTLSSLDFQIDASLEIDHVVESGSPWIQPNGTLSNIVIVGGSADSPLGNPLLVFSDNYFTVRYRPKEGVPTVAGSDWSRWMTPKLVESWIKRALAGINPFTQRTDDLYNNPISTDVSILTQAGTRWEGDVALTLNNIDDFGLIEIYETLLNRAKNLSIDAGYDDPGTNDTLLLTVGYLNDLYITLGNEASDDADNPTIAIDGTFSSTEVNTSRFSFEGQVASLIDEELALLRGRDDFLSPGVTSAPSYNRLFWNYINGIDSGEAIYALNYDIRDQSISGDNPDGTIDAADAQRMFPQGHGDAYGHYLTALTGYYKLLTSPHFTWTPRSEAVNILGLTVQIDYQDERKFAAAAAQVARVGARVLDLTARASYRDDPSVGWAHQRDGKTNSATGITRHWGTDEWASRAGQGAYFHWVSANAMLPDVDTNPAHTGIQIIDRTTVPEISEIVSSAIDIQTTLDAQSAHLNPLGLAKGAIAFDISPTELLSGKSHYEQIYERALRASLNAKAAFYQASSMNRLLRDQNNTLATYSDAVEDQERAYQYQLINIFGSAYPGDIGPGKLYEQGYTGPDLYHYYYINKPSDFVDTSTTVDVEFREPVEMNPFTTWSLDTAYNRIRDPFQYTIRSRAIAPDRLMQFAAADMGSRVQPGTLQSALLAAYQAQVNARESANTLESLNRRFDRDYQLFTEFRTAYQDANEDAGDKLDQAASFLTASSSLTNSAALLKLSTGFISDISAATAEAFPSVAGLAIDATSAARGLALYGGATTAYAQGLAGLAFENTVAYLEAEAANLQAQADDFYTQYAWDSEDRQHVVEFERLLDQVLAHRYELARRLGELQKANEEVARLIARANRILAEREIFRQRAAAVIQGYRTRDMTYRTFRNEELSQYQALFDLAAQYTYLALQSYDYETGLLGRPAGQALIDGIVSTRSLGDFKLGQPVATTGSTGDSGLAGLLARLQADWSVVKSRLGINNPDTYGTLFSMRQELFRVRTDQSIPDDDKAWQQVLEQHIMSNVLNDPDVAQYARNIRKPDGSPVPGIVIPFSTTIGQGLNFFGLPIAAGDHAYTMSNFATKIAASGLVLKGYIGMDPYSIGSPGAGGPASSDPNALSATPYVYLIPVGVDHMLAPPLGDTNEIRAWSVKDQAIPLPFNLGQSDFSSTQFFTPQGTLNEQLWITRKHQAFRPVDDPAYFYSTLPHEFTNRRLIGRSVWNTQWKLVIPANTLLNNEQEALDRFVRSVNDIQIFLRTYSHSGN